MKPAALTPEQALASAYLDGDVTTVERATVDASPELLGLVASLRNAAAMIAAFASPFVLLLNKKLEIAALALLMTLLLLWRHRANITRLMHGEEPKIGAKA